MSLSIFATEVGIIPAIPIHAARLSGCSIRQQIGSLRCDRGGAVRRMLQPRKESWTVLMVVVPVLMVVAAHTATLSLVDVSNLL